MSGIFEGIPQEDEIPFHGPWAGYREGDGVVEVRFAIVVSDSIGSVEDDIVKHYAGQMAERIGKIMYDLGLVKPYVKIANPLLSSPTMLDTIVGITVTVKKEEQNMTLAEKIAEAVGKGLTVEIGPSGHAKTFKIAVSKDKVGGWFTVSREVLTDGTFDEIAAQLINDIMNGTIPMFGELP